MSYLETLQQELADTQHKLPRCDTEARPVLQRHIRQIEKDIDAILRKTEPDRVRR